MLGLSKGVQVKGTHIWNNKNVHFTYNKLHQSFHMLIFLKYKTFIYKNKNNKANDIVKTENKMELVMQ